MSPAAKAHLSLLPALLATGLLLASGASEHPRLKEQMPAGTREKLSLGTLFLSEKLPAKGAVGLLVHFHGPAWIAEIAGARAGMAALSVQLGTGSAVYGKPFTDAKRARKAYTLWAAPARPPPIISTTCTACRRCWLGESTKEDRTRPENANRGASWRPYLHDCPAAGSDRWTDR
jgi:hypothetical protein